MLPWPKATHTVHLQKKTQFSPEHIYRPQKDWTDLKIEKPVKRIEGRLDPEYVSEQIRLARRRA